MCVVAVIRIPGQRAINSIGSWSNERWSTTWLSVLAIFRHNVNLEGNLNEGEGERVKL